MKSLQSKVIVITGASQGLGAKLAKKVAMEGTHVALVARTENLLKDLKKNILKNGGIAEYFLCDITDLKAVKKTVKEIFNTFKTIDILVNNAGIWTDDSLEKKSPSRRHDALEVNTLGHIQFTHEVLPYFKKKNEGYIFNVISTAGVSDIPSGDNTQWKTYGATKWAMTGFTKALRDSLKTTKIKVTGFFPGGFESNLYENAGRKDSHDQPWMMKTGDVAEIIVFALSRPKDVLMERIVVAKI